MLKVKIFVAEFIGTFALVFIGAAAGIYGKSLGILGIALAHGLTLAVFVYAFGHISGTHINPAVTLGLAANGNIKWNDAILYWVAQFAGGVLAAFLLRMFVTPLSTDAFSGAMTSGLLTSEHPYYALAMEALLTFFLMNTILHTAVDGKAGPFAGWAIGTTLVIAILAGQPLTGASLNPARSFGPALFTSTITTGRPDYQNTILYLTYFIGPFLGAIAAAFLYRFFKWEPETSEVIEDVEVVEEEVVFVETSERKPVRKPAARKTTRSKR